MTDYATYIQFKEANKSKIELLATEFVALEEETHWELVENMKSILGSIRANESSGDDAEIDNVLEDSDEWVVTNCSSGGIKEDVAMALWLYGPDKGQKLLQDAQLKAGDMTHVADTAPKG